MSKTRFTPGPWMALAPEERHIYDGTDITTFCVYDSGGNEQVTGNLYLGSSEIAMGEVTANTHLIAAAPEMYELLDQCGELLASESGGNGDLLGKIDDLLAKARGES